MLTVVRNPETHDTMVGGADTARVHGITLRDKGYTPVGDVTMTKAEYEAMRRLVEAA